MRSEKEIGENLEKLKGEVLLEFIIAQDIKDNLERLGSLNEVAIKNSKVRALSWVLELREKL